MNSVLFENVVRESGGSVAVRVFPIGQDLKDGGAVHHDGGR